MHFYTAFAVCLFILLLPIETESIFWRRRRRRRRNPPHPTPCPARDCTVNGWSSWSACTHLCGNSGTMTRTRRVLTSQSCSGTCPYNLRETIPCNRGHCQNGGTPQNRYCSCRTGYTGTCCARGEFILSPARSII